MSETIRKSAKECHAEIVKGLQEAMEYPDAELVDKVRVEIWNLEAGKWAARVVHYPGVGQVYGGVHATEEGAHRAAVDQVARVLRVQP